MYYCNTDLTIVHLPLILAIHVMTTVYNVLMPMYNMYKCAHTLNDVCT